jgi:hypothetical protein
MSENKTQPTAVSPKDFIAKLGHEQKEAEANILLDLFAKVTGEEPKMWGDSIIGYGTYHYKYESGREGDFFDYRIFSAKNKIFTLFNGWFYETHGFIE